MEQAVLKEGYALKNVRIWFTKLNRAKYISHLDLNRCMTRVIHRARIPIWYTEGFNPHPFITFALPLSLGIQGKRESMDIRLIENMDKKELINRLNLCLPEDIRVFDVTDQVMKPKEIAYALFEVDFTPENIALAELTKSLNEFFEKDSIFVEKKTKSGFKTIDLKAELNKFEFKNEDGFIKLFLTLPAGNTNNVNPILFINEFKKLAGNSFFYDITRLNLYNRNMEIFA